MHKLLRDQTVQSRDSTPTTNEQAGKATKRPFIAIQHKQRQQHMGYKVLMGMPVIARGGSIKAPHYWRAFSGSL